MVDEHDRRAPVLQPGEREETRPGLQGSQQEKTLKHADMFPSDKQIQEVEIWVVIK